MQYKTANYTQQPNEFVDEQMSKLSGAEVKMMLVIFRRTLGFHTQLASISLTTFMKLTGLSKQGVVNTINSLKKKKAIKVNVGKGGKSSTYQLHFESNGEEEAEKKLQEEEEVEENTAKKASQPSRPRVVNQVDQSGKPSRPRVVKQVDTLNKGKEILKEKDKDMSQISMRLAVFLFNLILKINPKHKQPNFSKWAKDIDKLITIDGRTPEEIKEVIEFVNSSPFWQANILSASKLREKFDRLFIEMNKNTSSDRPSQIKNKNESKPGSMIPKNIHKMKSGSRPSGE